MLRSWANAAAKDSDTAAFDLLMLHQGQIDLIGVAPAAPLLPNQHGD